MIGSESNIGVQRAITMPAGVSPVRATGATALEAAALRERMDGVSMKLEEVDHRVGALEAARHNDVHVSQDDGSDKSGLSREHSDVRAADASAKLKSADQPEPSPGRPESPVAASPVAAGGGTDPHPRVPAPASGSLVLMLTDAQFERWLGNGLSSPIDLAGQKGEETRASGDWRLRRNSAARTRIRR